MENPERLTNFYVFVSDVPFTSTNLATTLSQSGVSSYQTTGQCGFPTEITINRTGRYVRVQLAGTNYLHMAEVQVLGVSGPTNVALSKTATQSSTHASGAAASRAVDGNTDGVFANNSVTHTLSDANAWWHVDLGQVETIGTIKIWNRVEFPERLTNFYVFVSDVPFTSTNLATTLSQSGVSSYQTTGQCGFPTELAINRTGRYVRVQLAGTNFLSIAEVQVWTGSSTPPVQWLISDQLGTPRMILDQTGALASMKRHDYLPFGEELVAPISGRSAAQGYASGDGVRQQFTAQERDAETGLDYFMARYYSPTQGRFTSPDVFTNDSQVSDPQSWNKYAYVRNNPLRYVDPTGEKATVKITTDEKNKTGTIVITASIAIWTPTGNGITGDDMNDAAFFIEQDIEQAWSGTYVQDGITYTVTTDVTVTVAKDEKEAKKSQNAIEVTNGPRGDTDSDVNRHFSGADTGRWNLGKGTDGGIIGGVARHEFTHLLGVNNRDGGKFLSTSPWLTNPRPSLVATPYDYGWALGGIINTHRGQGRSQTYRGRQWETLGATTGPNYGPPVSHQSTHTLRAPRVFGWWR